MSQFWCEFSVFVCFLFFLFFDFSAPRFELELRRENATNIRRARGNLAQLELSAHFGDSRRRRSPSPQAMRKSKSPARSKAQFRQQTTYFDRITKDELNKLDTKSWNLNTLLQGKSLGETKNTTMK